MLYGCGIINVSTRRGLYSHLKENVQKNHTFPYQKVMNEELYTKSAGSKTKEIATVWTYSE